MKAKFFWTVVLTLSFIGVVSCNQSPIFYTISTETAPLEALIEGSPTNMVLFDRGSGPALYVASGGLYWYGLDDDGISSKWGLGKYSIPQPGGNIIALAVVGDYLYALCIIDHNVRTVLNRIKNDPKEGWENVGSEGEGGGYSLIQSIHADPDSEPGSPGRLFASARQDSNTKEVYAVLYLDDPAPGNAPILRILRSDTSILSGAAYREDLEDKEEEDDDDTYKTYHYLCTNGGGVFRVAEADLAAKDISKVVTLSDGTKDDANRHFMGMIKLKDENETIIAVERGHNSEGERGAFFKITGNSFEQMKKPSGEVIAAGKYATGALTLWEHPSDSSIKLLIAGIQFGLDNNTTTSYTYGYVEFDLNADGSLKGDTSPRGQGNNLISLLDGKQDRYTASIGKHSINHLFQAPLKVDKLKTFFASTQKDGFWSYKDRHDGNGLQWNAEPKPKKD